MASISIQPVAIALHLAVGIGLLLEFAATLTRAL